MKQSVLLTIASVLSVLFFSLHLADDIVRGFEPGGLKHIQSMHMLAVWLYGTIT